MLVGALLIPPALAPPRSVAEIVAAGAEPLRDLVGAMHCKLLLAELARHRG